MDRILPLNGSPHGAAVLDGAVSSPPAGGEAPADDSATASGTPAGTDAGSDGGSEPAVESVAWPGLTVVPALDRRVEAALREELRAEISQLMGERRVLAPSPADREAIRALVRERIAEHRRRAANTNEPLGADPVQLEQRLLDSLLGLGRIDSLMRDPDIEEIIINAPCRIWIVSHGQKRYLPDVEFDDDREVRELVKRLVGPLGKRLDESSPMVDARLSDGSRLNAVIPPASTQWTCVTIRKFVIRASRLEDLVALGAMPAEVAEFLDCAVQAGVNLVISGATGSGKTTLLNALGASIASLQERIITAEECPELTLDRQLPDCVALQARPPNLEGAGEIKMRDLVRNALRMRPSRLLLGECRGPEALDVLMAMNTGHRGSMTTVHGDSPRDALERLITLAMTAPEAMTEETITRMVAHTVELVLQLRSDQLTGRRWLSTVFEVVGLEGHTLTGNDLWRCDSEPGKGHWTGIQPRCLAKFRERGIAYALPAEREQAGR